MVALIAVRCRECLLKLERKRESELPRDMERPLQSLATEPEAVERMTKNGRFATRVLFSILKGEKVR